jgi:hypothetical protein
MGYFDWLKTLLRRRDQLTVELAEDGVASEDEKEWTEEQVEKHRHSEEKSDS